MNKISILVILMFLALITGINMGDGKGDRQLYITSLIIQFDKTDATFTVNYDFGKLPNLYLIMFGSKSIVPKIETIFSDFDFDIIKIDNNKAVLNVKNISRLNKGFYLHDSHKFGDIIDTVYISDSSNNVKEYHNINSTPYYFYRWYIFFINGAGEWYDNSRRGQKING